MIAKRRLKLEESLKKGYATIYNQCLQEVKDKLEATNYWETTQRDQSLHKLISKIERICVVSMTTSRRYSTSCRH